MLKIYKVINDDYEHAVYDLDGDGRELPEIRYSDRSPRCTALMYLPAEKKEKYPLAVFIHSGGFMQSNKSRHLSNLLNLLQYGYACASIDYRLNDETVYSGSLDDAVEALNYLSELDCIDSDRIALWGESYGSYLALDIIARFPGRLRFTPACVIDMYAAADLADFHIYKKEHGQVIRNSGTDNDLRIFGTDEEHILEVIRSQSFLDHFNGTEPPVLILHGEKDDVIPLKYSLLLEAGTEHELEVFPGGKHGIDFYAVPEYNRIIIDFIRKHTK